MSKIVTYVSNSTFSKRDKLIADNLSIILNDCKNIKELFSLIGSLNFKSDIIAIDVDEFYNMGGINLFDIIQTLTTLLECSDHNTKICAVVNTKTDISIIKDILGLDI